MDVSKTYFSPGCDGLVVHSTGCGLCNRVPALACFAAIAESRKVPLWCFWTQDDHCPGLPDEAFEFSSFFWKPIGEDTFLKLLRNLRAPALFPYTYTSAPVRHFADLDPTHPEPAYWIEQATRFQRKLRPNAVVVAKMEDLDSRAAPRAQRIGLHVRRTDLAGYGAPGGPKTNSQRDTALYKRLDDIADKALMASWVVCCDNPDSLFVLKKRYGTRIVHSGAEWQLAGMRATTLTDAALDLYALASCPLILGTGGSTFSTSASQIGGSKLEWV